MWDFTAYQQLFYTFFARLGGVDWWNHITLRKHLSEGLKDEESSNCEKYTFIENKHFFGLLFSWRDGSIFVSISLEIHSSQVWSESICSRICSPLKQNRWREQVNNQHTLEKPPRARYKTSVRLIRWCPFRYLLRWGKRVTLLCQLRTQQGEPTKSRQNLEPCQISQFHLRLVNFT